MMPGKAFVLTGHCSHDGCEKRSLVAQKLPIPGPVWFEQCGIHLGQPMTFTKNTLKRSGAELTVDFKSALPSLQENGLVKR